jgi:hypothetical protein
MGLALAVSSSFAPADAQVPRVIARQMSGVPPIGRIAWVEQIAITDGGVWAIEADTTYWATPNEDGVILKNDVIEHREGDPLTTPTGAKLRFFQSLSLARDGRIASASLMSGTTGFADDGGVFLGDTLLIQEGGTPPGTGWNPGTFYVWFSDVQLNVNGQVLVRGYVFDPFAAGCIDYFISILNTDAGGNFTSETLLAVEASGLPGIDDPVESIRFGPDAAAFNDAGQALFTVNLDQGPDSTMDGTVWYYDGVTSSLLAREGTPSPVPGRNWGYLFRPSLSLNNNGDWVIRDQLDDSDVLTDDVIVKNGVKLVQEGDVLPSIAPYHLRKFGIGAAHLTDAGDVLWYGKWSSPDQSRNEGLFLNDQLIVQEGVTMSPDGQLVTRIDDRDGKHYISPDGRYVIFLGFRADGKQAVFLLDFEDPVTQLCFGTGLGTSCPCGNEGVPGAGCAGANGLGGARLNVEGTPSLSNDTLSLTVENVPGATALVFLQGTATSSPTLFGNGLRCTDGALSRFGGRFANGNSVATGFGTVDGSISAQGAVGAPGTRAYQVMYRNPAGFCSGSGVNLSSGVRVTWEP